MPVYRRRKPIKLFKVELKFRFRWNKPQTEIERKLILTQFERFKCFFG